MAHFAELDSDNKVIRVLVVDNKDILVNGIESEQAGIDILTELCGGRWIQTSYNGNFRKRYAGPGMIYDQIRDAFIAEKIYPSWVFNENSLEWEPPYPKPIDLGKRFFWDEETTSWVEYNV